MLQPLIFDFTDNPHVMDGSAVIHRNGKLLSMLNVPSHPFWIDIRGEEYRDKKPSRLFTCEEIEPGIYWASNFEHDINKHSDHRAVNSYERLGLDGIPRSFDASNAHDSFIDYFENTLEPYGVADDLDQIKEKYKSILATESRIVISVAEVRKDEQPSRGGWRWHKWGEYIGMHKKEYEYLYDETGIESVLLFHIHVVQPKVITSTPVTTL